MRTRAILLFAWFLIQTVTLFGGDVYVKESDHRASLGNDSLELTLDWSDGRLKLQSIHNKLGPSPTLTDDGFVLQVIDKTELTARDFVVSGADSEPLGKDGKRLTLRLSNTDHGIDIRIAYELKKDNFFARRKFAIRNTGAKDITIRRAEIERLSTDAECALGGRGQPVFVGGSLFLGLEYPAAYNYVKGQQISLFHYPGKKLGKDFIDLKSEVIGVSADGKVRDAFMQYLRRIRIPPRSFVLYNSWYDVRRKDMSNAIFIDCFDEFKRKLIDRYGVKLNTFVIDDGYQDKQSIWKTDKSILPEDFYKLANHLKANGSVFGIWMPLTPNSHNLDLDWGRANGYEVTDTGGNYCISGPKFNQALRNIIAFHIREFGLNYYKHDFNNFNCAAEGHGHLPDRTCGFESNVDAYIEVLKYTRKLNPDVFINITGGMWLSPWWLMYADTVWRGGGDTGHERVVPYIEVRDDTMTYVDGVIWDRLVKEGLQFPPSALMTHGICYGRYRMLGGKNEPFHRWTEHIINYMAPGVMMIELYITPSLLSDEQWAVLAPTLAWAVAQQDVLAEGKMTHGNPHKGEVYGYKHVKDGRLIWFLRNPSMTAQTVELPVAKELGGQPAVARITYPYRLSVSGQDTITLDVPPFQTMVVEAAAKPTNDIRIEGCRYGIISEGDGKLALDLIGLPGTKAAVTITSPTPIRTVLRNGIAVLERQSKQISFDVAFSDSNQQYKIEDRSEDKRGNKNRIRLSIPSDVTEAKLAVLCEQVMNVVPMGRFKLNGQVIKPKVVHGEGWRFFLVPLPQGQSEVCWEIPQRKRPTQPFAPREMTVSSWLFCRRKLPTQRIEITFDGKPHQAKRLPTPFANVNPTCRPVQDRRVVATLLPDADVAIAKNELSKIKAAKLHVNVFGVNYEDKYRNKPVLLNGTDIGILPPNRRPLDAWQEQIMNIPKEKLDIIKAKNTIVFTNPTNDCFKIADVGLAVQLADGTWVETNREKEVHCSVGKGWIHSEGTLFEKSKSKAIRLRFSVR
ncbi:MAG: hypothetical protein GXP25_23455 [Planctomycetes bacterium]|nr:hypothetical protein [Planctomycetota bacterium]